MMNDQSLPRILIVEDEQIVANDLQQSLLEMGYDAFAIAASADEAVKSSSFRSPDVVLMDIRIKGALDGIQTAEILKAQFPVSIIYLTAHADDRMLDRAKKTEPHGYLLKPVKAGELKSMIEITLHKRNLELELKKSYEQIRNLAQRLEIVREAERRAVATQLHDGIAQDLFALKLGIAQLEALAKRKRSIKRLCREITTEIVSCMDATRLVANELRPAALAYSSVATVIEEHARHFAKRSDLQVTVSEIDRKIQLDEARQLLLFRAAQEALTNIARHARASKVDIALRTADGRILLEIVDDGVGIADDALQSPRSLGLLGLRERFAARGGVLMVSREAKSGTRVTASLPMTPNIEDSHAA